MTTREARGLAATETEEESIARYLQHNPDFFERHQPLLARLRLPHVRSGSTVSLVERQVEVLREKHARARAASSRSSCASRAPTTRSPTSCIASRVACCARARASNALAADRGEPARRLRRLPFGALLIGDRRRTLRRERFLRMCAPDDPTPEVLRNAVRQRQAALRPGAGLAARVPVRPRSQRHRLGGAGAAGREGLARPAGARQRRSRSLPSRA